MDITISKKMIDLSNLSYSNNLQYIKDYINDNYNITNIEYININNIQCFLLNDNNDTYIVFRGTNTIYDFFINLEAKLTKTKYGNIHYGCYNEVSSIYNIILKFIDMYEYNNIYITGHSFGGSLSNVLGLLLYYRENIKNIYLYTFGALKVFDESTSIKFEEDICTHVFRFVNKRDIIPHFPIFHVYKHVGDSLIIYNNKILVQNISHSIYTSIYNIIKKIICNGYKLYINHKSETYLNNINKLL